MKDLPAHLDNKTTRCYWILSGLALISGLIGIYVDQPLGIIVIPMILLIIAGLATSIRQLYVLLFFLIPFSIELELPGGLGTDFPTEPLLWLITAIGIVYVMRKPKLFIHRGFGLIILLQMIWGITTLLFAEYPLISFKYLLAKTWYIVPFYFLPFYVFDNDDNWNKAIKALLLATMIAGSYAFINHGFSGWTFSSRTLAGAPFFRNHVNYSCLLLLCLPASYFMFQETKEKKYIFLLLIFLVLLQFTYARIVYLSIAIALMSLICMRLKILKVAFVVGLMGAMFSGIYILSGDRLISLAPEYEQTISHQSFDQLIEASYKMQDISTMERAYRWIAGINMIQERPILGFGPSNFYNTYRPYTNNSFQTYVSDNPEKSGIHNYYLMLAVEQGIPGLLIFLGMVWYLIIQAEKKFHVRAPEQRNRIELAILWLMMILSISLLNDMIEVIKVGPFFFLAGYLIDNTNLPT